MHNKRPKMLLSDPFSEQQMFKNAFFLFPPRLRWESLQRFPKPPGWIKRSYFLGKRKKRRNGREERERREWAFPHFLFHKLTTAGVDFVCCRLRVCGSSSWSTKTLFILLKHRNTNRQLRWFIPSDFEQRLCNVVHVLLLVFVNPRVNMVVCASKLCFFSVVGRKQKVLKDSCKRWAWFVCIKCSVMP